MSRRACQLPSLCLIFSLPAAFLSCHFLVFFFNSPHLLLMLSCPTVMPAEEAAAREHPRHEAGGARGRGTVPPGHHTYRPLGCFRRQRLPSKYCVRLIKHMLIDLCLAGQQRLPCQCWREARCTAICCLFLVSSVLQVFYARFKAYSRNRHIRESND